MFENILNLMYYSLIMKTLGHEGETNELHMEIIEELKKKQMFVDFGIQQLVKEYVQK